jgi:Putative prokaryotic signal transducing protein
MYVVTIRRLGIYIAFFQALIFDIAPALILFFNMKDEWVVAFVTYDSIEAEMIKDLLESGGIDAVIRSAKVTPYPVNLGKMGEVTIFVREKDREAAEEMIRKIKEQDNVE